MSKPYFNVGDRVQCLSFCAAKLASGKISIIYTDADDPGGKNKYSKPFNAAWTSTRYVVDWEGGYRTDCTFAENELLSLNQEDKDGKA